MMRDLLLVSLGGAVGAGGRYLITHLMHLRWATHFPIGTLTVNVLGCLLIGVAVQASHATVLTVPARMLLVTGVLGALTTFSTFGHDTYHCWDAFGWKLALANILANVVVGLLAVLAGLTVGGAIWPVTRG
jgi:CrcB protein